MRAIPRAAALAALTAIAGCASLPPTHRVPGPPSGQAAADTPALYLNIVSGLVEQQRYGAALAFLDDFALKQSQLTPRYWLLRGDALLGLNRAPDALQAYAKLDGTALTAEGWNGRGQVAAASQNWRDAEANFNKASAMRPANAQFLNNLAFSELQLGQAPHAAFYLRQAHELDPSSVLIRNNLIMALAASGDGAGIDRALNTIADAGERQRVRDFARKASASTPKTGGKT